MTTPLIEPNATPMSDEHYIVLSRAKRCAICNKSKPDSVDPVVPVSYGGAADKVGNLWAVHQRCGQLRHQINGSSPKPPDPEGLRRVLALLPDMMGCLDFAATNHLRKWDSIDTITNLTRQIEANVGYGLEYSMRPASISEADWAWLSSPAAYDAIHSACWALLRADA